MIKYDRHGYKPRERVLILTENAVYILDTLKTFKLKHRLPYKSIEELVVTGESDNLLIVRIPPELKKDKVRHYCILIKNIISDFIFSFIFYLGRFNIGSTLYNRGINKSN